MAQSNRVGPEDLRPEDYHALSDFRYQIRRFLHFSEEAAKSEGIEPQQHQMLLAIKTSQPAGGPTIGRLAEYLFIRHHSAVGLIDRLEERSLIARNRDDSDRRQVHIQLTASGEAVLQRLTDAHREELRQLGPVLVAALQKVMEDNVSASQESNS